MKFSPWILGAAALVPVMGAYAGANVGTDPIGPGADVTAALPASSASVRDAAPVTHERLPDHYAMETPEGRVEVADLAWRGRYRDHSISRYDPERVSFDEADFDRRMASLDARWQGDDLDARAAASLDVRQPDMPYPPRFEEAPHFSEMARARTGEAAAVPPANLEQPVEIPSDMAVSEPMTIKAENRQRVRPRTVDVAAQLAVR
ncbi:hypothetical protein [Aurantiacibacter spongiae]|uniref:Uncharacterized protein n=1 Tax=Aurantiacibacter spongiae TaxID=2488860 RepID=A0A3N5CZP2_9SPHN|nr:hypothetical protein [Aurantiacibacter spongiae]RPF72199.1 hypothetical protein EG799_11640 [Aurantiacibacter spongiae]